MVFYEYTHTLRLDRRRLIGGSGGGRHVDRGFSVELQALRGLAALIVLMAHCASAVALPAGIGPFRFILNSGGAVVFFFVLSGFVLGAFGAAAIAQAPFFATLALIAATTAVSIPASALAYAVVEKPFIAVGRQASGWLSPIVTQTLALAGLAPRRAD